MSTPTKIRANLNGDVTEVKMLMSHDMETGRRKDGNGLTIPAKYIVEVQVSHNGQRLLHAEWGYRVSKNPYMSFKFKGGAVGDSIAVSWTDSSGDTRSDETRIA